jgi:hypothetical protein
MIVIGTVLSILGLGLSKFDFDILKDNGSKKWYRTIDFDFENKQFSYGLINFIN